MHFADLHDTPGRMKAKGVIRRQVQWAESRTVFYWRLRRPLLEFGEVNSCCSSGSGGVNKASATGERKQAIQQLKQWYCATAAAAAVGGETEASMARATAAWEDDRVMVRWFQEHDAQVQAYIADTLSRACIAEIGNKLSELVRASSGKGAVGTTEILKQAILSLPESERAQILAAMV